MTNPKQAPSAEEVAALIPELRHRGSQMIKVQANGVVHQRLLVDMGLMTEAANALAALRSAREADAQDARRWRAGVGLKMFPEFCGHDDYAKRGRSWYMPDDKPQPYETAEEAIDAALACPAPAKDVSSSPVATPPQSQGVPQK